MLKYQLLGGLANIANTSQYFRTGPRCIPPALLTVLTSLCRRDAATCCSGDIQEILHSHLLAAFLGGQEAGFGEVSSLLTFWKRPSLSVRVSAKGTSAFGKLLSSSQ